MSAESISDYVSRIYHGLKILDVVKKMLVRVMKCDDEALEVFVRFFTTDYSLFLSVHFALTLQESSFSQQYAEKNSLFRIGLDQSRANTVIH